MSRFVQYAGETFRVRLLVSGTVIVEKREWGNGGWMFGVDEKGKLLNTRGCTMSEDDPIFVRAQAFYDDGVSEHIIEDEVRYLRFGEPINHYCPPAVMMVQTATYMNSPMTTAALVWSPTEPHPRLEDTTMVYGLKERVLLLAIDMAKNDEVES